jgi:hypothetical protein
MNTKWLKFMNSKIKGGAVRSFVLTPVTGALDSFTFIDSYPNFEAWAMGQAALATPDGAAINAEFDTINKCASSNLHTSTES